MDFRPATPKQFLDGLLARFYAHVHPFVEDNYDRHRFSYDGVDRSREFARKGHVAYMSFVVENRDSLFAVWLRLSDQASRELFVQLLLYRLLGHLHVRIAEGATWSADEALYAQANAWRKGPSALDVRWVFAFDHFEGVPLHGQTLSVDCNQGGLITLLKGQYYLERDGVRIRPEPGDVVIDAGAFVGETAVGNRAASSPSIPCRITGRPSPTTSARTGSTPGWRSSPGPWPTACSRSTRPR
jgi:hypothetical protein